MLSFIIIIYNLIHMYNHVVVEQDLSNFIVTLNSCFKNINALID